MKKILLLALVIGVGAGNGFSQATNTMKEIASSVCDCMTKKDMKSIKNEQEAKTIFMNCFIGNGPLLMKLVDEGKIDMTDESSGEQVGVEIAKELFRQNCPAFAQLSLMLVDTAEPKSTSRATATAAATSGTSVTAGRLARVENKEFLYFVVTDAANREQSFIWLHYFQGSEKFIKDPASYVGKSLKIRWQETEVFMPSAKGYFKIKEIAGIDIE
jgi:hypothetical protein